MKGTHTITVVGARGGVGVTTICTLLVKQVKARGLTVGVYGFPGEWTDAEFADAVVDPDDGTVDVHIIDAGTIREGFPHAGYKLIVVRNDYRSLRAVSMSAPDGVLAIIEDRRALDRTDVDSVIEAPAWFLDENMSVARADDAGLLWMHTAPLTYRVVLDEILDAACKQVS